MGSGAVAQDPARAGARVLAITEGNLAIDHGGYGATMVNGERAITGGNSVYHLADIKS